MELTYFKASFNAICVKGNDSGLFSALAMNSVGKAVMDMVKVVRCQPKRNPR
jgi:Na+/H+-translocating membrane pyrophosphatase